jgi:glycosyltransferase involved in cell wall biosynthesis
MMLERVKKRESEYLPLVTAIITTYDRPMLARRAIKSALSQTYELLEIIVVEDGSESGIAAWIDERHDEKIRYIRHQKNRGLAAARNTGLKAAYGDYVAYLDDDDEWLPDKLARQVVHVEGLRYSPEVVYCAAEVVSAGNELLGKLKPSLQGNIRDAIKKRGLHTIPSSCLFRRDALLRIDGYDEDLASHIDHDIWLKMARENFISDYLDDVLVKMYYHHGDRITLDDTTRMQAAHDFCKKWHRYLVEWFDEKDAHIYCSRFKARVLGMLAWANLERGYRWKSIGQFLIAIRYHPSHGRHIRGLFASLLGYPAYNYLRWLGKKISECFYEKVSS